MLLTSVAVVSSRPPWFPFRHCNVVPCAFWAHSRALCTAAQSNSAQVQRNPSFPVSRLEQGSRRDGESQQQGLSRRGYKHTAARWRTWQKARFCCYLQQYCSRFSTGTRQGQITNLHAIEIPPMSGINFHTSPRTSNSKEMWHSATGFQIFATAEKQQETGNLCSGHGCRC